MQTMIDLMFAEPAASNWIQIMKTGEWNHPQYGPMKITSADLHKFKENFDSKIRGVDLAIDVSHQPDKGAVGWFQELKVDGDKLMAKVKWTKEGAELIKSGKYRYFSPEFSFKYKDAESGKEYTDVLMGGGITNRPFLKNMTPIELSEDGSFVMFADSYDPDHDNDDDSTTNPKKNPDWMDDVKLGHTKWPTDPKQQEQLKAAGISKDACDMAFDKYQAMLKNTGQPTDPQKMSESDFNGFVVALFAEGDVTNAHKSPPKGKPQSKDQYADPEHYKYPIDEQHIRAAVAYFNHPDEKSKGGYSDAQWSAIGHKIATAANRLIGKGHEFKDGKIVTDESKKMDDGTMDPNNTNPNDGITQPHQPDDKNSGKFTEPNGGATMTEVVKLQEKIKLLEDKNRRMELTETVKGYVHNESTKSGKLAPAQQDKVVDFMMTLNDEQTKAFKEFMDALPDTFKFSQEEGFPANPNHQDKETMITQLAEKKMQDNKELSYRDALIIASEEVETRGVN